MKTPKTADELWPHLHAFKDWLRQHGATLLELHPEHDQCEIVRFIAHDNILVVARNRNGKLSFNPERAKVALQAFFGGHRWSAVTRVERLNVNFSLHRTLFKRDKGLCFFCQCKVDPMHCSTEHLVAISNGGPNHIDNLYLSHGACNTNASHLSTREKIQLHMAAIVRRHTKESHEQSSDPLRDRLHPESGLHGPDQRAA